MILSASSGSGHTRAAEALEAACKDMPGIASVEHIDVLEYTTTLFKQLYADLYEQMVRKAPTMWGWWYDKSDTPWKGEKFRVAMERIQMRPLLELLRTRKPDITICTHFLASDIVSYMLQEKQLSTSHAVVVTDMHVHALWLCHYFERYFVATKESEYYLQQLGIPKERIVLSGIPIHPSFSQPMDRDALRKKHKVDLSLPVILVSAGTFGMESSIDVVRALMHLQHPAQIITICGRNDELLQAVKKLAETAPPHLKFRALGYVTDMHEWMALADLFVGKPGGLTLSEALASSLPMVLVNPIPGQEAINASGLLERGVAVSPTDIITIPHKIDVLLHAPRHLAAMRKKMQTLARPRAAYTIIESLLATPPSFKRKEQKATSDQTDADPLDG